MECAPIFSFLLAFLFDHEIHGQLTISTTIRQPTSVLAKVILRLNFDFALMLPQSNLLLANHQTKNLHLA